MSTPTITDRAARARQELAAQERRDDARRMYRESVAAELPMTAQALGQAYSRSARWGRDRIAEVRTTDATDPEQPEQPTAAEPSPHADTAPAAVKEEPDREHQEHAAEPDRLPPAEAEPVKPDAGMPQEPTSPVPAAVGMPPQPTSATAPKASMPHQAPCRPSGRAVSWLAFLFGIAATVAANVAHTFYPSGRQLAAWSATGHTGAFHPEPGAVIGAGFWPLALLLAVEVLARVAWPAGGWWQVARYAGAGAVAGVAALMSYRHMAGLLTAWGEDPISAYLGPLAVDGLMVLAGFALLSMGARRHTTRRP